MTYILNIETSTTNCSVCLSQGKDVIKVLEDNDVSYSHAERLHTYIQRVVEESGIQFKNLSAISVSRGPGSYTGLRIGVSAAKGLAYALDIPLIAIPTLTILASQVNEEGGYIVPMIDARRMEVYSAVFSDNHEEHRETKAEVLEKESFEKYLTKNKVRFIGNGVQKFSEICTHQNAIFIKNKLPSAKEMAALSYTKFLDKDFADVSYLNPDYLKDFVTNRKN